MSKIIENIDDVKLLLNQYEWLKEQSERLFDDEHFDEIENLEWYDDDLTIYYSTYYKGCIEHLNATVPISWLFLDDEQLKTAKKEKKEVEEETKRMQKELNEMFRKKAQEQKEHEEYERLKKKFEGDEING